MLTVDGEVGEAVERLLARVDQRLVEVEDQEDARGLVVAVGHDGASVGWR